MTGQRVKSCISKDNAMKELRNLLFWASVGLLAMLLVFVFASCKSPQPTLSVNREVKDNTEEQVSKVSTDSLTASISRDVKRLYDKVSDLEIESKKTKWSAPDSTGRQFPTETTETTARNKIHEKEQVDKSFKVEIQRMLLFIEELNRKIDVLSKENIVETPKLTKWQKLKMNIGGFAITLSAIFIWTIILWLAIRIKKK